MIRPVCAGHDRLKNKIKADSYTNMEGGEMGVGREKEWRHV